MLELAQARQRLQLAPQLLRLRRSADSVLYARGSAESVRVRLQ